MISRRAVRTIIKPTLTGDEDGEFFDRIISSYVGDINHMRHFSPMAQYRYLFKLMDKAVREIEGE